MREESGGKFTGKIVIMDDVGYAGNKRRVGACPDRTAGSDGGDEGMIGRLNDLKIYESVRDLASGIRFQTESLPLPPDLILPA